MIQIALKAGHHRPASETPADDGPTSNAVLVDLQFNFLGDLDQYCLETLYFPPLWIRAWSSQYLDMHAQVHVSSRPSDKTASGMLAHICKCISKSF